MPLTPEQLATRNAARRALAHRVAVRSMLGTLALVLAAAVLGWWLLTTIGGRNVLLAQVVARLPAGTTLTWQRAEGPVSGPMTLHGIRFSMPRARDAACVATPGHSCAMGTIVFTADTIVLDPALRPLLGRTLRLDTLTVAGATLDLPTSTKPFEFPRWPDSLPQIAPPLGLRADAIRIDGLRVTRDGAALVDIRSARGGIDAASGRLHVEHVVVDSNRGRFTAHGDYLPRDDYRSDLTATAVLPAVAGRATPAFGLVARGDLSRMDVALAGNAPAPLRATLTLHGKDAPHWALAAHTQALDPQLLVGAVAGIPIAFDVRLDGVGGDAALRGTVARGDLQVAIQPSRLALADQVLDVHPLIVDMFGGRVTLQGRADLRDPAKASMRFAVNARGLHWAGTTTASPVRADADFGIAGRPDAWAAIGNATLLRDKATARVHVDARGDGAQAILNAVHASTPGGALDARGRVAWSPALRWDLTAQLTGFDPGYFLPDWDGTLVGRIASAGSARNGGDFDATLDVPQLRGRLRGRTLQANAQLLMQGSAYRGNGDLSLGNSRVHVQGRVTDTLDIDARFSPLQLADLLPQASGALHGSLHVGGGRAAPDVTADLSGSGLSYAGYRVGVLSASGHLPWQRGSGTLTLDARDLVAGTALDRLHLQARGAVEALHLQGDLQAPVGAMTFAGSLDKRGGNWSGALAALKVAPAKGAAWQLQAPARFVQNGARLTLSHSCFAAAGGGALCASVDWPRQGIDVDAHALPLALATPYLPPRSDGRPWLLRGAVDFTARVRSAQGGWHGNAHLASASGGLRNSERSRHDLVAYDQLVVDASFDPRHVDVRLGTSLDGNGRIDAHVAGGWDAYAPLAGEVAFATDALTWMELLSPDIVEPTGHLRGRIALGGTRAQPALGGDAKLSNFSTDMPALGIALTQGALRLDAQADGSARLHGSVRSGDGTLRIDGTLGWKGLEPGGQSTPLVLAVTGRNVLASDTRDLRAVIDPDVVVRYAAGKPLDVSGRVRVPSANLDLARLDRGATTSSDVVVLDPVDPTRGIATPLALDLTLAMGDDVRLHGFGLEGTLSGSLRVRAQPGHDTLATGTLDVGGRYVAYGQKLDVTRGELTWTNSPVGDPRLDIRAQREIQDVTAGIDVTGYATRPQVQAWTDPASDPSQALALLALGRPLSSASSVETQQLDVAGAALSAGGNLIASKLGARLGLDNAGVSDSRALGGSVLGVGKFLSPRLYVGYGVSLLGTGQVLTLKYLLRKGFDIEIESSTVENRASANWRKEK
ncbi:MAG: translocation/assembly module TamB domain-containing protein [Luteimonas sp.]